MNYVSFEKNNTYAICNRVTINSTRFIAVNVFGPFYVTISFTCTRDSVINVCVFKQTHLIESDFRFSIPRSESDIGDVSFSTHTNNTNGGEKTIKFYITKYHTFFAISQKRYFNRLVKFNQR